MLEKFRQARARAALVVVVIAATLTVTATTVSIGGVPPVAGLAPSSTPPIPASAFRPILPSAEVDPSSDRTTSVGRVIRQPDGWFGGVQFQAPRADPTLTAQLAAPAGPTHLVRSGDTLWQIATWHRSDVSLMLLWNDVDPRRLVANQRILVPGGKPMPAGSGPASVTVTRNRAPAPTAAAARTRHFWPLSIRGTITTRFSTAHPGIDIAAPAGTTVRAIASGTVTWAGWKDNGGGFVVVIRHPDGMTSTFNHNRGVAVVRGDRVKAGQKIASVGATGRATGPHLDLRIEMGGRFVNPLRLF